ncbi:MAG: uL15 family ribosomal protein [Propionibacteriaceae bacterium]|jgi:hypothetical protein|nr:uL15 family ribosomal protein [Propionibacteriaceae bacterium]
MRVKTLPALIVVALLASMLSGCDEILNIPLTSDPATQLDSWTVLPQPGLDEEQAGADETPTAEPEPEPGPTGPPPKMTCKNASKSLLAHLEQVGNVGLEASFSAGKAVHAYGQWWAVAVRVEVAPWSDLDRSIWKDGITFITTEPAPADELTDGLHGVQSSGDEGPGGVKVWWGEDAADKAKSCLGKRAAPKLSCAKLSKTELKKAKELVKVYYGGSVTKSVKVKVNNFSVLATRIEGAIGGVKGANDQHPKDASVTWRYREFAGQRDITQITDNWVGADEKKYGPKARKLALKCLG